MTADCPICLGDDPDEPYDSVRVQVGHLLLQAHKTDKLLARGARYDGLRYWQAGIALLRRVADTLERQAMEAEDRRDAA